MSISSRNGVGPSRVSLPPGPWVTVLDFLSEKMPEVSRQEWTDRLQKQSVLNQYGEPIAWDQTYTPHQIIYYFRHIDNENALPFKASVIFEDERLLVADKPHFMPVTPSGRYVQQSLLVQMKRMTGLDELVPLHRIDRETAGVVLLSKRAVDRSAYHALFREHKIHKTYHAIAAHRSDLVWPRIHQSRMVPDEVFFRMKEVPGPSNSETRITLLSTNGQSALYELEPVTGKRHQLRVHMMALGLPLKGDQFYPVVLRGPKEPENFTQPLQLLAKRISFKDPVTDNATTFESQQQLLLT